jgi:ribose 1,5-bisphosphokinase PhnN
MGHPARRLLVVVGPSGAGKSTLVRELLRRRTIELTPSWTTRSPRRDEAVGVPEHVFVSDAEFDARRHAGFFLETVSLFGARYGLPPVPEPAGGRVPALMLRAPVLPLLFRRYPNSVVYQVEGDYAGAPAVLTERAVAAASRRDGRAAETAAGRRVATRVFHNDTTVADLVAAVEAGMALDFPGATGSAEVLRVSEVMEA